jgi:MSHA biogenesis protein MshE
MEHKTRLGELLVQDGLITKEQLNLALDKRGVEKGKIGSILVKHGYITEATLYNYLAKQFGAVFIDLKQFPINPELVFHLPETTARRLQAIVLERQGDSLLVGMTEPQNIIVYDELTRLLQTPLKLALVKEEELLHTFDLVYRHTEDINLFAKQLSEEVTVSKFDLAQLGTTSGVDDATVVKLLQSVFEDAVQIHASDIHIEPDEAVLRIRMRVDGVLQESIMKESEIAPALTLRLKLMAGLKIDERRLPQDGRFSMKVRNKNIDVRLSTMPIQNGESVVMRLLDRGMGTMRLEQLGMAPPILKKLRKIIRLPNGMILVTGPTGSGKTSTLYSVLNELNDKGKKIITVEDPVEYRLPRVNQVQVNPHIDLSFARVLRTVLRQDPDIIMVGEIRDAETASIALRAAMTGHFVLATMHTNDAISSAMRLLDIGGEGYMVASALRAVIAQRLVRRICENCAEDYTPTAQEAAWIKVVSNGKNLPKNTGFKVGKGCPRCNNSGYKGRIGVQELLEFDDDVTEALLSGNLKEFAKTAQSKGFGTLGQAALAVAVQGVTSLQEAMQITVAFVDTPEV